jgi:transposase
MRTRTFRLTEEQANELHAAYLQCQDADTKTRYQAVRLYGLGYAVAQIKDICGCSTTSLMQWCRAYRLNDLTALLDHRLGGNRARLTPFQIEAISNQLHTYTPAQLLGRDDCWAAGSFWTLAHLAKLVERDYGVTFQSPTSYRTLLAQCDFSYQRPAKQYKSHSDVKRMEFEETLEKKSSISPSMLPIRRS